MESIGIDISKAKVDCCWIRDLNNLKVKTKVFKNTQQGFEELSKWLLQQTGEEPVNIRVVMEATGVYYEPLAYALTDLGFVICVVNPARPKEFAKSLGSQHKTDAKDSLVLALFGARMDPRPWEPESTEVRVLKALTARLEALEADLMREENRLEKAEFSRSSERVIESLNQMISYLKFEKKKLEDDIDDHFDRHPDLKKDRELLMSIPAIGPVVSRVIVGVIRSRSFQSGSQVSAFLGLIPRLQESGQWKGRSRMTKSGPSKVRAKLYMAAVVALSNNPDIKEQHRRLMLAGKTKMQALGAAMRKLVQICFGVLKHQSEYRPQCI